MKNTFAARDHLKPFTIIALAAISMAQAAEITWDTVVTFNNTTRLAVSADVSTEGDTVLALQQNGAGAGNTVNGVVFTNATTQSGVTFTRTTGLTSTYNEFVGGTVVVDGTTASTPYRSLLTGAWYGGNPAVFTFSGLTVGQEYLVQVWTSDLRPGLNGYSYNYLTMSDATNTNPPQMLFYNNGTGSTVVGRFTATDTTATFNQDATGSYSAYGLVNGIQLRAVTTAPPDPYDEWAGENGYNLVGGPGDDDDDDGLSNFDEFAFGLDPTSGASVNPITDTSELATLGLFSYSRLANSGLTYTVWVSTDLQDWGNEPAVVTEEAGAPDPQTGVHIVNVELNDPPAGGKVFVRVKAD